MAINQHCFRYWLGTAQETSHYLNQWWPTSLMHICGSRGRWLKVSQSYLFFDRLFQWQQIKCHTSLSLVLSEGNHTLTGGFTLQRVSITGSSFFPWHQDEQKKFMQRSSLSTFGHPVHAHHLISFDPITEYNNTNMTDEGLKWIHNQSWVYTDMS